jgi:hypothetical protein
LEDQVAQRHIEQNSVVKGPPGRILGKSHPACGISLWIAVDSEGNHILVGESSAKVDGCRGFSHAPFLIGNGYYAAHYHLTRSRSPNLSKERLIRKAKGFPRFHVKHFPLVRLPANTVDEQYAPRRPEGTLAGTEWVVPIPRPLRVIS